MHIFIPIRIGPTADEVLSLRSSCLARLAAARPKELTVEHSIAARGNRVYLDAFRNGAVQTVVSPYSVRRKPHAPVSTPLNWSEVKPSLDPASFNIGNFRSSAEEEGPVGGLFQEPADLAKCDGKTEEI